MQGSASDGVGHRTQPGATAGTIGAADPGPDLTAPSARLTDRVRRILARVLVHGGIAATRWLARVLGESPTTGREQISEAELRLLVAANTVLDGDERKIIDEVLAAAGRHVRELMVPRTEVVFLEAGMSIAVAARLVRTARHSRFPVIDGTHDDVIGFVHLRDLLIRPDTDMADTVRELTRELKRLPASLRLLPALSEMRREGHHVALVVDEYGGTAGIVTLEDLIEELVGEIHDEYDAAPEPGLAEGVFPAEVEGLLNLTDFAERVGVELPPGPYDTVGGYLMSRLGRLPRLHDEVRLTTGDTEWRLRVAGLDGRRVARVALSATPVARPAPPDPTRVEPGVRLADG
jgi:putative hemolysin